MRARGVRNRAWFRRLATTCLLMGAYPATGAAQEEPADPLRVWVEVGPMLGAARNLEVEVGAALHLRVQKSHHRFALRLLGMGDATSSSSDVVGELALLYGRGIVRPSAFLAVSAGPGLVAVDGVPTNLRGRQLKSNKHKSLQI